MRRRQSKVFPLCALIVGALLGCQDAARPLIPNPAMTVAIEPAPLVPRIIAPQTTDPAIDWVPTFNPQLMRIACRPVCRRAIGLPTR